MNISTVLNTAKAYFSAKISYHKMQAQEGSAKAIFYVVMGLSLLSVGLFVLIFLSVTLGLLFNYLLNSPWLGFGIVTLLYIIIFVVIILMRKTLQKKINNAILS